jgi:putative transposase
MGEVTSLPLPRGWPLLVKSALLHAVGLERLALTEVRSALEHSLDPRARQAAEIGRLRERVAMREEEIRIKDARLAALPAARRPHYPPAERLAILMLRAKTGWSAAETARRFLLSPQTVASWMRRLDESGPDALVQTRQPIARFPDYVAELVQKLYAAAPALGRRKLAEVLARAGLVLAASTVRRMLKKEFDAPPPGPNANTNAKARETARPTMLRTVTARYPGHVWHCDLTSIATSAGWWVPWFPFALIPLWPFCWHIALVVDHCSRALVAFAVFKKEPTAAEVCAVLERAIETSRSAPRYIVSDRGTQFQSKYCQWCRERGIKPRFGAIGKKGSIALIERFIRSLKDEWLRKILVPLALPRMQAELARYQLWYNEHRPHSTLQGMTPTERLAGKTLACHTRLEPRAKMPLARGSPSTRAARRVRGRLELVVTHVDGCVQLPVIELRDAA